MNVKMTPKNLARTAVLIAVLVSLQYATASLGQFVTGSCVNLVLAVSALFLGLWEGGFIVAAVSPILAFALGVGPKLSNLIPFIILGNLVYVAVLALLYKKLGKLPQSLAAVAAAAACKFLTLYFGVVKLALPAFGLPEKQAAAMSAMFSWPQLVTALIGGILAALIVPRLKAAFKE